MILIWWFRLRYIVKTTRRGNVALTQNRAASFQATRRCRGLLWLAGWLPFLASIDPIGEALATATPNTFSHWLLAKMSVYTVQNRHSSLWNYEIYIGCEVAVNHSDTRIIDRKISSFFFCDDIYNDHSMTIMQRN